MTREGVVKNAQEKGEYTTYKVNVYEDSDYTRVMRPHSQVVSGG